MFSILYNQVFIVMGEFFGKLVAVATMPFAEFIDALYVGGYIFYTNIMTGYGNTFQFVTGVVGSPVLSVVLRIFSFGVNTALPVWAVVLTSFVSVYLIVAIIRFII